MPFNDKEKLRLWRIKYSAENKVKVAERKRNYYQANRDKLIAEQKERYRIQKTKPERIERQAQWEKKLAEWEAARPFRRRDESRRYRAAMSPERKALYKEKANARARKRYAEDPERIKKFVKEWSKANPEKIRENSRVSSVRRRARKAGAECGLTKGIVNKLLALQSGKCPICRQDLDKFHIDHVFPLARGGKHTDDNVQLLCPDCNMKKGAKDPMEYMQSVGYLL